MTTTGYAARARTLLERGSEKSEKSQIAVIQKVSTQREKSEKSEKSPYAPLDEVIAASEAGRRSVDEIERRLARLVAQAAEPEATPLDRQLVRDWTAIRDAKLSSCEAA